MKLSWLRYALPATAIGLGCVLWSVRREQVSWRPQPLKIQECCENQFLPNGDWQVMADSQTVVASGHGEAHLFHQPPQLLSSISKTKLLDIASKYNVDRLHDTPDGRRMVGISYPAIREGDTYHVLFFEASSGALLHRTQPPKIQNADAINFSFSANSKLMAFLEPEGAGTRFFDVVTGKHLWVGDANEYRFSPDGRYVIGARDTPRGKSELAMYEARTGKRVCPVTVPATETPITDFLLTPDNNYCLMANSQGRWWKVRVR